MFVVTFYSYKGGVGRSLAVANVAAELARRGKSVLIADFDLEAPGATSFDFGDNTIAGAPGLGLVDFIEAWLSKGQSPAVSDYLHLCRNASDDGGTITIMPAGRVDADYGSRLNSIDFSDLYANHDGFLLFEDLRAQWRALSFDYVLLDSRTGHTDVGGVCTRQLPDLVAFVFWPNDQNLNGLKLILEEIRLERGRAPVRLLFVPSNLPTLDDENGLLQKRLRNFRTSLNYGAGQEVRIYNYPSLDLLEQTLFTVRRRNSRLGRDYQALADAIQQENSSDEEGVRLRLVKELAISRKSKGKPRGEPSQLNTGEDAWSFDVLSAREWQNPEIFRLLAMLASSEGDPYGTVRMIKALISRGADDLADNLVLAQTAPYTGDTFDVPSVVNRLLDDSTAGQQHVVAAINLLAAHREYITEFEANLSSRPAVKNLTYRQIVSSSELLNADLVKTGLIANIALAGMRDGNLGKVEDYGGRASQICLPLIASGHFSDAASILEKVASTSSARTVRTLFNLAMARWGIDGRPPLQLLEEIVLMDATSGELSANYNQCMALAYVELGEHVKAIAAIEQSRAEIQRKSRAFSCWSYLEETQIVFAEQLNKILVRLESGSPEPEFITRNGVVNKVKLI